VGFPLYLSLYASAHTGYLSLRPGSEFVVVPVTLLATRFSVRAIRSCDSVEASYYAPDIRSLIQMGYYHSLRRAAQELDLLADSLLLVQYRK
jgi:hypothetical protein